MDLDFYKVSIKVHDGQDNPPINIVTIKTNATSYKHIFEVPKTSDSNSLTAQVFFFFFFFSL